MFLSTLRALQRVYILRESVPLLVKCLATDPVCKMKVDENAAKFKSEYQGKTYYFCAPGCKKEFEKNPKKYL